MIFDPYVSHTEEEMIAAREQIKKSYSFVCAKEQYNRMCEYIDGLSDNDLVMMIVQAQYEARKEYGEHGPTPKEALNTHRDILRHLGLKSKDIAANSFPAETLNETENDILVKRIKNSHTSDYLFFTEKEDDFLIDLWEGNPEDVYIPSDLFFSKTVPLKDCVISVDETGKEGNGKVCKYRVVVFDDYYETVDRLIEAEGNEIGVVGAVIPLNILEGQVKEFCFFPLTICFGTDACIGGKIGWLDDKLKDKIRMLSRGFYIQMFVSLMETWYGLQIALLHPTVKDVFKNPQRCSEETGGKGNNNTRRKRKVKYVRKHVLTIDKLEEISRSKEARKINRKCLAWYVIGHWRTYKNGKKVFVMPYWKGVLRNLKQNSEGDDRERQIGFTQIYPKPKDKQERGDDGER